MTDRELLEMAARAAGLIRCENYWTDERGNHISFNPLTDDGDALRLAVKLELEISRGDDEGACVIVGYYQSSDIKYLYEQEDNDPYAATRRAIVRAAAEIGKGMP